MNPDERAGVAERAEHVANQSVSEVGKSIDVGGLVELRMTGRGAGQKAEREEE
ncbi:MAG: hypothetical protein Q8N18_07735 [Opitutaceae bacterium]|nr:hypothetical protein [Opitutaceae bacterium]